MTTTVGPKGLLTQALSDSRATVAMTVMRVTQLSSLMNVVPEITKT